jgi:predicted glycogen debranching enzyme
MDAPDPLAEWLEADGLGGFASGTVSGVRTRRYHNVLLVATTPPTGRILLVNGFDAWVQTPASTSALSSQEYHPGVTHPDGAQRIRSFQWEPWPLWEFVLEDGTEVEQELIVAKGESLVALCWRLTKGSPRRSSRKVSADASGGVRLSVRPLLSGRDYHALHHENGAFNFHPISPDQSQSAPSDLTLMWRPYVGLPTIIMSANGTYQHQPDWYRNFLYEQERERGLDDAEDLASPGLFQWDLTMGEAIWLLAASPSEKQPPVLTPVASTVKRLRAAEQTRRRTFQSTLHRAADSYVVKRANGKTVVAGYPWFTDWGRDTFISLRGLCLVGGRMDIARDLLLDWADTLSEGLMPNRFPDAGGTAEYNSADASLWYVIAVGDCLRAANAQRLKLSTDSIERLQATVEDILAHYVKGTRYCIGADDDGLLAAGEPGVQLTWMDAKTGDYVVTPRIGKPVEVQALWLNALLIAGQWSDRWRGLYECGHTAFRKRFWCEEGYLYDVVDCDHQPGTVDPAFRPNQIFAVGGLPTALLEGEQARRVVEAVESRLWTPLGLRSLAPSEPGYRPYYRGSLSERDGAYHQGVAWPWLLGPFVEAWLRVRRSTNKAKSEAQSRFLQPLLRHLDEAGLGHVSEIADAEPPYTPRGCPFQAWSVGEALRVSAMLTGSERPARRSKRGSGARPERLR